MDGEGSPRGRWRQGGSWEVAEMTLSIQEVEENRAPVCCDGHGLSKVGRSPPGRDPACVEPQPASLGQAGDSEGSPPPPRRLFLFHVNSSCRSNIDKYSRECFSGRRMLPEHFLTIFGKNRSFCEFQRDGGREGPHVYCPH